MLIAIVTSGYHGMATYHWEKDGENLENEFFPVIYPTSVGEYVCHISVDKCRVFLKLTFMVTSGRNCKLFIRMCDDNSWKYRLQ